MNLKGRIQKLERRRPASAVLEIKLRRYAEGTGEDLERLRRVVTAAGIKEQLNRDMNEQGQITWPAFCQLRELLHPGEGQGNTSPDWGIACDDWADNFADLLAIPGVHLGGREFPMPGGVSA